jgi:hypothetical protein
MSLYKDALHVCSVPSRSLPATDRAPVWLVGCAGADTIITLALVYKFRTMNTKTPFQGTKHLRFLIPPDWDGTTPLPWKFVIFFDAITESIAAAQYLRGLMPLEFREKIKWFNSEMSPEFRVDESDKFNKGINYGLCCTESFGMVSDPNCCAKV